MNDWMRAHTNASSKQQIKNENNCPNKGLPYGRVAEIRKETSFMLAAALFFNIPNLPPDTNNSLHTKLHNQNEMKKKKKTSNKEKNRRLH